MHTTVKKCTILPKQQIIGSLCLRQETSVQKLMYNAIIFHRISKYLYGEKRIQILYAILCFVSLFVKQLNQKPLNIGKDNLVRKINVLITNILGCLIFNYQVNQMRLRHKKPINSYAGQANHDSNDAQDEDFIRGSISYKKGQLVKQRSSCEKIKKYAQFLCNFVNSVNQNYRNHAIQNGLNSSEVLDKKESKQLNQLLFSSENKQENNCDKIQEVVSKQQQKIQKTLKIINKDAELTKKIKKDRLRTYQLSKNAEVKKTNLSIRFTDNCKKNITLNTISVEPSKPPKIIDNQIQVPAQQSSLQNVQSIVQKPSDIQNQKPPLQMPSNALNEQLQNLIQIQKQILMNPLYGALNPNLYSMMNSYGLPPFINYQAYLEQIKNNPYFNMGNSMINPLMMMPPSMMNNFIPFSRLPFANNVDVDKRNGQLNEKKIPDHNMKLETNRQPIKQKKEQQKPAQPDSPIVFKSKSCYHIGIAFNIHFANLKEKGLANFANSIDYQKIDPTYPAKRVKQRKISDNLANLNQTSAIPH